MTKNKGNDIFWIIILILIGIIVSGYIIYGEIQENVAEECLERIARDYCISQKSVFIEINYIWHHLNKYEIDFFKCRPWDSDSRTRDNDKIFYFLEEELDGCER